MLRELITKFYKMDLLQEAFIEGYKQRAESSNLIFDNASRMYAISLFDKWKSEQLLLHNVVGRSEQLPTDKEIEKNWKDLEGSGLDTKLEKWD